jgi:predicted cupin superfamily sugar epimerase
VYSAQQLIDYLGMKPLPAEGGFFVETYRSNHLLSALELPQRGGPRSVATSIYYLLTSNTCSKLHRLKSDEMFHFYLGDPVEMWHLSPDGNGKLFTLGHDLLAGHHCQLLVPNGTWQGARLKPGGDWALMGCTVAPGFDFADFELGQCDSLLKQYPAFAQHIKALT